MVKEGLGLVKMIAEAKVKTGHVAVFLQWIGAERHWFKTIKEAGFDQSGKVIGHWKKDSGT